MGNLFQTTKIGSDWFTTKPIHQETGRRSEGRHVQGDGTGEETAEGRRRAGGDTPFAAERAEAPVEPVQTGMS